jgi:thymidine phosphorylase
MNPVDIIRSKRDGGELSDDDIRAFLAAYTAGDVADEQASALLMAIFFRGLSERELATWTAAMIASGDRLDLAAVERPTVDKHSTGGVGDKLSLPLVPLVAACGAAVPQLSGRGLGHTGGTLDKMESIPGWRAALSNDEIVDQLRTIGGVICAAGAGLAPADRKLYALRDVTATVESIPLIASSIMSKKIAEGTSSLVLDVKVGSGAFMKAESDARRLAETMVALGAAHGVRATAFLTRMDTPLGRAVGHSVEVAEAVDVLGGGGPPDVVELTTTLAGEMVALAGLDADPAAVLDEGAARPVWDALVRAQGGDPDAPLPEPTAIEPVRAPAAGYVTRLDALAVGVAAWRLGAGRSRKEDPVSASAGIVCLAKEGDAVDEGQPVLELHVDDAGRVASAREALVGAFDVGPEPPAARPLVIDVLRA